MEFVSTSKMSARRCVKLFKWIPLLFGIITVPYIMTQREYQIEQTVDPGTVEKKQVCNIHNGARFRITGVIAPVKCPDVGECMMRGRWRTRPITSLEKQKVDDYIFCYRREHGVAETLQRSDGKCFSLSSDGGNGRFRALCDPDGPTPCCCDNICVNKTFKDCKCPGCQDLRNLIHAEYSTWQPEDPRCMVKNFTAKEACDLLQGATVAFVGDSLMRHLYTVLLTVLTNNGHDGAIDSNAPKDIQNRCAGWKILTEKVCLPWIKWNVTVCNNSVRFQFFEYFRSSFSQTFLDLGTSLYGENKSLLVAGIGLHEDYEFTKVFHKFLWPFLQNQIDNGSVWPKVVWSAADSSSLIVSKVDIEEELHKTRIFNQLMRDRMERYGVTVFDTFNMTKGVATPDGTHYGFGLNLMKAQMFLNLVLEMRDRLEW
ncbi:uncharacterized protein [Haliotis cracherodii]|uniref:uncharacterized protein n=1 Tax=Haliotis cracherodii TaxID=6455 RepID=UPI0039E8A590